MRIVATIVLREPERPEEGISFGEAAEELLQMWDVWKSKPMVAGRDIKWCLESEHHGVVEHLGAKVLNVKLEEDE